MLPLHFLKFGILWMGMVLGAAQPVFAQEAAPSDSSGLEPPPFLTARASEDYSHLKDPESNPYAKGFGDALKFIPLNRSRSAYFTLGGEYRIRMEHFTNQDWTPENDTYFSQRLALHGKFNLGKYFSAFAELYHGFTNGEERFLQSDPLDLHQAFLEFRLPGQDSAQVLLRLGRQEKSFGASRLVGLRDGPNLRRAFDLGSLVFQRGNLSLEALYGKEVAVGFEAFDNASNIFNANAGNPSIWGLHTTFKIGKDLGMNDLYYLGFHSPFSVFNDGTGEEIRHAIGLRRYGKIAKRASFNSELIVQVGQLGDLPVRAFNLEADWKQRLSQRRKWRPTLGLKLDWSSGDRVRGDGRINTFNPYFVNPAIYSLAGVNTPANLISIHPNFSLVPRKGVFIYLEYALQFRATAADGLYAPPRFLTRPAANLEERSIGGVAGLILGWEIHRNLDLDLMSSLYLPGNFIQASGDSETTFFIAPTLDFTF